VSADSSAILPFQTIHALTTSFLTVSFSIKSVFNSYPRPGFSGTVINPFADTVTSGSMMSSFQYRFDADTSPGNVKFGSVE
jgi:hypothetical protein